MSFKYKYVLAVLFVALLGGCKDTPAVKSRPEPVRRLDRFALRYQDADSSQAVEFQPAVDVLLGILSSNRGRPVSFDDYSRSEAVAIFQPDIERRLPSLDSVSDILGCVRDRMALVLPDVRWRSLYGVVTPFRQTVMTSDSITLIGLNHYLGPDYKGYDGFENYLRRLKTPDRIPVDVAGATIAADYPYRQSQRPVVLERMLYEGAMIYAMTQIIPDTDARTILGYTPEQWHWAIDNEADAWAALASRDLLYSTDKTVSAKLNNPSPATVLLNHEAPGMLGRFIGYRIVADYVRNNQSADVAFLLTPEFYNSRSSLVRSGYSPHRR